MYGSILQSDRGNEESEGKKQQQMGESIKVRSECIHEKHDILY